MDHRVLPAILAVISAAFLTGCIGSQGGAAVGQSLLESQKPAADQQNPSAASMEPSAAPPSEIKWVNSYEEGLKAAQDKNKPVLLYFWAVWCSFCAKMDKEVLSDGEVSTLLKGSFVPVLIDVDKEANYKYLSDYKVVGTPTFVILTPQGGLIRGIVGYKNKKEFIDFLRGG